MPEENQDSAPLAFKDGILSILRGSDKSMLQESGNPVYLAMKTKLEQYHERYGDITSSPRSPSPTSFASAYAADPDIHDPGRFFKVPILGIRIGPDGERLVYCVAWPYGTPEPTEVEASERIDDPDKTLTDITSNAKSTSSESK